MSGEHQPPSPQSSNKSSNEGHGQKGEGHKEGLIQRSYHMLFIIYAPLALISIVVTVLSDKYINYVFMTAFLTACLSVVLAVIMWWLFWKHREVIKQESIAHLPYLIRHQFIMLYLPIAFISMGICAYYVYDRIYDKYVDAVEQFDQTALTNITMLLPISNRLGRELEDVLQIKRSLGSFLINNPELFNQYHFEFIDHKNHYSSQFEQAVVAHLKSGTHYFICAYSDVCSTLANNLDKLSETAGISTRPVIVTTLSSSMQMPLAKDQFYRFFVRNREDAQVLAKYAFDKGLKTAAYIATEDAYGKDAVAEFTKSWQDFGGSVGGGVYIDPLLSENVASDKVLSHLAIFEKVDAVFVALYQPATNALAQLSNDKLMLISANYQHHQLDALGRNGSNMDNIVVSFPRYKAESTHLINTAGLFLYMTLSKLIDADQKTAEGSTFHDAWIKTDEPAYLKFQRDGENDFSVLMQVLPYKELATRYSK